MSIKQRNLCTRTAQNKMSLYMYNQETNSISPQGDFSKQIIPQKLANSKLYRFPGYLGKIRLILTLIIFSSLVQNVRSEQQQSRQTAARVFTFLEKYHFPVVQDSCNKYSENQMIQEFKNNNYTVFYERYIIFQAVKAVIGNDAQVNFKCVENYEADNSDDPLDEYAGKFGSEKKFYLETEDHYQSIPSLFYEKIFIQKQNIIDVASFSVFDYLNYLFYLGIFLIPAVTGGTLLLFKDLNTFYDYQRVVYSVFRYLNRQGDQQMSLWLHKILSLFVALFFFFSYSILLSEMTAKRRQSISLQQINIDIFRDIQNYPKNFSVQDTSYSLLYVDLYQYLYLLNEYEINSSFQDQSTTHYNVQFSKNYFTKDEIQQLNLQILSFSIQGGIQNNQFSLINQFNNRNDEIFLNWLILAVGLLAGFIFKCLQMKFSYLNQYTEIQSYREQVNSNIATDFSELFRLRISQLLSQIQAKDHCQNFKQIPISQKCYSLGKLVFKVIVKRRKKKVLHKTRKQIKNLVSNGIEKKQKPNLYKVIKEFLIIEKKTAGQFSNIPSSTETRRYAMQAAMFTTMEEARESQKLIQNKEDFYQNTFQIRNKKISNSKNSQKDKLSGSFNALIKSIQPEYNTNKVDKKPHKVKTNERKDLNRRLTNLAFSHIHADSPKVEMKLANNNLPSTKIGNSNGSTPKSNDTNKIKMFQIQYLQQMDMIQQDGSNRNRRRGSNHILNIQQLQSIKIYEEQLHKKLHRRHSSYIKQLPEVPKFKIKQDDDDDDNDEKNNDKENDKNSSNQNDSQDNEQLNGIHFNLEDNNKPQKSQQMIRSSENIQDSMQNKQVTENTQSSQKYIQNNPSNSDEIRFSNVISPQSKEIQKIALNNMQSSINDQYYSNGIYNSNRSNQTDNGALYPKKINLFDFNNNNYDYQNTPYYNGERSNFNKEYLFTEDELIQENSQNMKADSIKEGSKQNYPTNSFIKEQFQNLKKEFQ